MSKKVKALMEREYQSRFESVEECAVVSLLGINGNDNNQMRGDLLKKNIRMTVVKNSLAQRAFEHLGRKAVNEFLAGPSVVVYGGESLVDVVKELVQWNKKLDNLQIKGSYLEGKALSAHATKELAKMPSRVELQGGLVMLAQSPGRRLAGAIGSPAATIAGCIKSLIEKLEAA